MARPTTLPHPALLRLAAIAVAFVLAALGFADSCARLGRHPALLDDLFNAAQLIIGKFPADLDGKPVSLSLSAARWVPPPLTLWTTVALGWAQARDLARLALIRLRGQHWVIAGDAGLARRVANGELAQGRRVLLWLAAGNLAWAEDVVARGAAKVDARGDTPAVEQLGLGKARGVLPLAPDDSGNTALASRVVARAREERSPGDPLEVIARIDNLDLRRDVEARFERAERSAARVRFASLPDIAARELFVANPLDAFRRGSAGFRAWLFRDGRAIPVADARGRPSSRRRPPRVRGPRLALLGQRSRVRARNPGTDTLSPIRFQTGEIDQAYLGGRLVDELTRAHGPPIAIVIDGGDDARSLALAIDDHHQGVGAACPPIHVHLSSRTEEGLGVSIVAFGGLDQVGDPETLLQGKHDALARSIHDFYLESRLNEGDRIGARDTMREWEDLSESFRDDNRLVADCCRLKLRDIGARLTSEPGPAPRFDGEELEELARAEHDRRVPPSSRPGGRMVPGRRRRAAASGHRRL